VCPRLSVKTGTPSSRRTMPECLISLSQPACCLLVQVHRIWHGASTPVADAAAWMQPLPDKYIAHRYCGLYAVVHLNECTCDIILCMVFSVCLIFKCLLDLLLLWSGSHVL